MGQISAEIYHYVVNIDQIQSSRSIKYGSLWKVREEKRCHVNSLLMVGLRMLKIFFCDMEAVAAPKYMLSATFSIHFEWLVREC